MTKAETTGHTMQIARMMFIPEGTAPLVHNSYIPHDDNSPELARRNVATYRGAKAFDLGHLIPETHFSKESTGLGTAMAKAPGMSPADAMETNQQSKVDLRHSKNMRDLLALQAYDFVAQSGYDRHHSNYHVAPSTRENQQGQVVETGGGIKGIDNDASWGTNPRHYEAGSTLFGHGGPKTGSHSLGLPPNLHRADAAKFEQMTKAKLKSNLGASAQYAGIGNRMGQTERIEDPYSTAS